MLLFRLLLLLMNSLTISASIMDIPIPEKQDFIIIIIKNILSIGATSELQLMLFLEAAQAVAVVDEQLNHVCIYHRHSHT